MNHLCSSASPLSLQHVTLFISSKTHYNIFTAVPLAWGLQGKLSCVTFQIFWKEPKLFLEAALLLPNPGASVRISFGVKLKKFLKSIFKDFWEEICGSLRGLVTLSVTCSDFAARTLSLGLTGKPKDFQRACCLRHTGAHTAYPAHIVQQSPD